jgi:hypothetical protein
MSNRKQSTASKPLFVKDRIDLAHRMQTSEGKPWGEYLDQAPVIHGGPMVTEMSLNLLGSMRVQHWETFNHAKARGVTVDRASGVEVMGIKQPQDALWGFTVYPVAVATKPAPKPASAKPKAVTRAPIAKPKPVRAPVAIKRRAKLGKLASYDAEYSAGLARASRGVFPDMTGFISEKERLMTRRVPCSLAAFGFTYTQLAKSWNNYVKANSKCGLKETSAQKLTECGQSTLAY